MSQNRQHQKPLFCRQLPETSVSLPRYSLARYFEENFGGSRSLSHLFAIRETTRRRLGDYPQETKRSGRRKTRERQNRNHGLYSEQRFQPRIPRYAPQNGTRVRHQSDRYRYGKQRQNTHRLLLNRRFGENLRDPRPCRILCRTRIIRPCPIYNDNNFTSIIDLYAYF